MENKILVETSARHVHVTQETLEILFGKGHELSVRNMLTQPGQYASTDKVTVPDVTGKTREQAQQAMADAGLYLKSTGLTVGDDVKAESQAIAGGTEVERGTVVEVHFIQSTASGGAGTGL